MKLGKEKSYACIQIYRPQKKMGVYLVEDKRRKQQAKERRRRVYDGCDD
jgi:hypothetical protein